MKGAHIDARDEYGNTALHLAAWMGFPGLTKELLKWGADVTLVNDDGLLAMEVAITRGLETDDDRIDKFSKVAKIIIEQMEPVRYNYDNTTRYICLLYTSPSPRDATLSRMPSSA